MYVNVKITNFNIPFDLDYDSIADVDALLRLGVGDVGRLNHIKSTLQDGKYLYNSDRRYLEGLKDRISGGKNHNTQNNEDVGGAPSREQSSYMDSSRNTQNNEGAKVNSVDDPKADFAKNPKVHREDTPAPTDGKIIIVTNPPRSSAAWYLLPIFLSIIGGTISYLCLRKQDPSRARRTFILGVVTEFKNETYALYLPCKTYKHA